MTFSNLLKSAAGISSICHEIGRHPEPVRLKPGGRRWYSSPPRAAGFPTVQRVPSTFT